MFLFNFVQSNCISVSRFIFSRRRPLKRLLQTWTGWVFKKGNTGSFLLQAVVDWLALHQEWLEENKYPFWRVTFEKTFQRPCCPVQDWLDSVDGIVPKAKVILLPILWYLHRQLQTADFLCCRECKVFIWKCKIGCRAGFFARGNETVMVGWLAVAERRCW